MKRLVSAFAIVASSLTFASAQQVKPGGIRIQTATRQVVLFSHLESDLNDAISQHDKNKLAAMLADDFEVRTPSLSGDPIPREEWITKAMSGELPQPSRRGGMAVRSFSDTAVVDFVEETATESSSPARFVVDVWKRSGQNWKLAVRYVSETQVKEADDAVKPTGKQ